MPTNLLGATCRQTAKACGSECGVVCNGAHWVGKGREGMARNGSQWIGAAGSEVREDHHPS
jgi:hypothetical protein